MTYQEIIQELTDKSIPPNDGELYDFVGFPLEEEFQAFQQFCQTHLDRDDMPYNIKPSRLYFSTYIGLNACAYRYKDYGLIEVYKGTIFKLKTLYASFSQALKDAPFEAIQNTTQKRKISPEQFLFQLSTQYFFYHELGHLIQRSNNQSLYMEYNEDNCQTSNILERHVLEMDADCYAAYCMAMHLIQFSEEEGDKINEPKAEILSEVVSFALAGLYIYYIEFSNKSPALYFQENCHPHPSIRISYIIKTLLDHIAINTTTEFNQEQTLKNAVETAIKLNDTDGRITEYSKSLYSNIDDIEGYIKLLIEYSDNFNYLALKII